MIYEYCIDGLTVRTGDVICTSDGTDQNVIGQLWKTLGHLVPGEIDHLALYIGPEGRCIEAGARGVITFSIPEGRWEPARMADQRWLIDTLVGVVYPLAERGLPTDEEQRIRAAVAAYCLEQAGAPYNINFFDSTTDAAFYCSQLIYKAYLAQGIDLNPRRPQLPLLGDKDIVFPQEIWQGSPRARASQPTPPDQPPTP